MPDVKTSILPHIDAVVQTPAWQQALAMAVRDPAELLSLLGLPGTLLEGARAAGQDFPLRVPRGYVARMHPGDASDPLLRQVLPLADETLSVAGYGIDPVGDLMAEHSPGLLRKYQGRALLIVTGACAVHCRYCFRRHYPYQDHGLRPSRWQSALDTLHDDTSISEIILSGGDPLALGDRQLESLTTAIQAIPHIRRLRIHTRLPVVLPERIDASCLAWLAALRLPTVMVIHANHSQELDTSVMQALQAIRNTGVTLLNQTVLLRGINDAATALCRLSETLFAAGVLPYYLHQLDKVAGAAHFAVSDAQALALLESMQRQLPGYLVPKLVREAAGEPYKLPLR